MSYEIRVSGGVYLRAAGPADGPAIWFLPGFADSSAAFSALFETALARRFRLFAPDLPGFGASPPLDGGLGFEDHAGILLDVIGDCCGDAPVGLVGHSVGSVIAAAAARRLGDRCAGLVSIEGNLTAKDAYFSGQAADYADGEAFKRAFAGKIWEKGQDDDIFRHYHAGFTHADAGTMWALGRSVRTYSEGGRPGLDYRALAAPTLYLWAPANTPDDTQAYIAAHGLANIQLDGTSHWPMLDAPDLVAGHIGRFFAAPWS